MKNNKVRKTEQIKVDKESFQLAKRDYVPIRKLSRRYAYNLFIKEKSPKGRTRYIKLTNMELVDVTSNDIKWVSCNTPSLQFARLFDSSEYGETWLVSTF